MGRTIGVVVSSRIVAGLIKEHKLVGSLRAYPENPDDHEALLEHPFESLCHLISDQVLALHPEGKFDAIGVAIPGIIRNGNCEDSPNLAQLKGAKVAESLAAIFQSKGIVAPVKTLNDADAVAAGLARSEERRGGKECRSRWSPYHLKKKIITGPGTTSPSWRGSEDCGARTRVHCL